MLRQFILTRAARGLGMSTYRAPMLGSMTCTRGMASKAATEQQQQPGGGVLAADSTNASQRIYHTSHLVLLGLLPVAVVSHPSALSFPVDLALALSLPVHAHIGMNWIATDYANNTAVRVALLLTTLFGTAGLLKLSFEGGITGSVLALWKGDEHSNKKKSNGGH